MSEWLVIVEMMCIDSLRCLLEKITMSNDEIIIYGMGDVSEKVLRYLDYENLLRYVCCVAVKNVEDNNIDITEYYGVHAFSLCELNHFRDTAMMIVCTAEDKHSEIEIELSDFGLNKCLFMSNRAINELRGWLADKEKDIIFKMNFRMSKVEHYQRRIQYMIREQNEISEVNHKAFEEYKNKFRDREIALIATGPSLKEYVPIKGVINIGVNFACKRKDISFDYLFFQDYLSYILELKRDENINELNIAFNNAEKVFIGSPTMRTTFYTGREFPYDFSSRSSNISRYIFSSPYEGDAPIFADICNHPLFGLDSIVFPAVQFSLFTGVKKIYLIGCDTKSTGHFYDIDMIPYERMNLQRMRLGWLRIKRFVEQFYPETEIVSVNPVGLKGLFRDVYMG